jgi:hypothetical protein
VTVPADELPSTSLAEREIGWVFNAGPDLWWKSKIDIGQVNPLTFTSTLERFLAVGAVDKNPPHRFRRRGKEMPLRPSIIERL